MLNNELLIIPSTNPFGYVETSLSASSNVSDDQPLNIVAISTTLVVLMAFTLFGNLLVLLAFYAQPRLRTVIYYPIISLTLADLLCAVTAMPLYIIKKNTSQNINERLVCDLYRFSYFFTEYASIMSLMAISIERFLIIHNPFKYRNFISSRIMTTGLIVCWLEAFLVSTMPFYWRSDRNENCTNSPTKDWSFVVIIINVFLPFLIMLLCHCYIYNKTLKEFNSNVDKARKEQHYCISKMNGAENWKMERRATVSFTVVIGIFVICWGPSTVYYFIRNICPQCFSESFKPWKDTVSATVKILTFSNSFMNPIVYFWLNMDFRKAFVRVLRREWQSKTQVHSRSRSGTANSQNTVTGNVITYL